MLLAKVSTRSPDKLLLISNPAFLDHQDDWIQCLARGKAFLS